MNVYERIKLFIKLLFSNEKELYSFCADLTGFCPRGIAIYRQALTHRSANASAINGIVVGSGSGYSKREAHQHAAEAAMKTLKKTNKMKITHYITILLLSLLLFNCKGQEDTQILHAESCLDKDPSESFKILQNIDANELSPMNRALYALIKTEALYKCDIPAESDSLINIALNHYKSGKRHIQSMIFKGIVEYEIGNNVDAINWLKKAEEATPKDDYETLGYINMQLGNIYLDSYIENKEDIRKYKKALIYYTKSHNQKRCQVLNGIIGGSYRSVNTDSACKYLNNAIALDTKAKDSLFLFLHTEMLARTFYQDSNYLKSKNLALYAITEGSDHCPADEAIHDAARAYAQLGRFDSANFFLSRLKQHNLSPEEKVKLLTTKTILFEKEGNFKEALVTYKEAADIADSIISSSHQQQLFLKEKCYDTQVLKTENIEIKHKKLTTIIGYSILVILLCTTFIVIYKKKQDQIKNILLVQEDFQSAHKLAMEDMLKQQSISEELHCALLSQISTVKQLIEKSYYFGNQTGKFNDAFQKMMRINTPNHNFWEGLKIHTNITFDNIITKLKTKYPALTEQDIYFICMRLCNFSAAEIIVCMGYTNSHSATNRQLRIAKKLNMEISLNEFILKVKNKEISF